MIYRFTEVLNDLVNYFLLGDILLLDGVVCVSASMESCIGLLEAAEGLAKTLWVAKQI